MWTQLTSTKCCCHSWDWIMLQGWVHEVAANEFDCNNEVGAGLRWHCLTCSAWRCIILLATLLASAASFSYFTEDDTVPTPGEDGGYSNKRLRQLCSTCTPAAPVSVNVCWCKCFVHSTSDLPCVISCRSDNAVANLPLLYRNQIHWPQLHAPIPVTLRLLCSQSESQ